MIIDSLTQIIAIQGLRPVSVSANTDLVLRATANWPKQLPVALQDLYAVFGLQGPQNFTNCDFTALSNLSSEGDLVFLRFAKGKMENGILDTDRHLPDPPVKERSRGESHWCSGGRSLASCLINLTAWNTSIGLSHVRKKRYSTKAIARLESLCEYVGGKSLNLSYIYYRSLIWKSGPVIACTYMDSQIVLASMSLSAIDELDSIVFS